MIPFLFYRKGVVFYIMKNIKGLLENCRVIYNAIFRILLTLNDLKLSKTTIMDLPLHTLSRYFAEKGKPNLPFNIELIDKNYVAGPREIHAHDYFQIILIDNGDAIHNIEYESPIVMKDYTISVVFPKQIHQITFSPDCKGLILMFDEALFCSDILKKELSSYNINLFHKLNFIEYQKTEYLKIRNIVSEITVLFNKISPIKKEQIRFYIKILLLQLIEYVHEKEQPAKNLLVVSIYAKYKDLIENQYIATRKVTDYASQLGISSKKLNEICKRESGMTALEVIHERLMVEIKRMLLFSGERIKEIAFTLGFASVSSFNKFIYSKTCKTPTELKNSLSQNYKEKD